MFGGRQADAIWSGRGTAPGGRADLGRSIFVVPGKIRGRSGGRGFLRLLGLDLGPRVLERDRPIEDRALRCRNLDRLRSTRAAPNWTASPTGAPTSEGSTKTPRSTVSDRGFRSPNTSRPSVPGIGEEVVVQPHLGRHRVRRRQPVEGRLRPATVGRVSAARRRVVGAPELDDRTRSVLDDLATRDEVRRPEPDLALGGEAKRLRRRVLLEVVALDPQLAPERDRPRPRRRGPPGC